MRNVKSIQLPTDYSDNAKVAIPAAAALDRQHDATPHLFPIVTPLPWPETR